MTHYGPERRRGLIRENAYRDVWLLLITGFVCWALIAAKQESVHRRDQACLLFERTYTDDVNQLQATYSYALGLTPEARKQPINQAILAQIPQTEAHARAAIPPRYCAPRDVGSNDVFPEIPKRPPGLLP